MHASCINLVQARLEAVSLLAVLSSINSWNSLPPSTDFSSVIAFKRSIISSVDFSQFQFFYVVKVKKGKGLDTCYSATYMSQTRDQRSGS